MFVRCGDTIVNTDQVVEIVVWTAEEREDGRARVEITTTAVTYDEIGYSDLSVVTKPYTIDLRGEAAEKFLAALPVYEPVMGEDS